MTDRHYGARTPGLLRFGLLLVAAGLIALLAAAAAIPASGWAAIKFKPTQNFKTNDHPQSVVVGDFNGDGKQDLALATFGNYRPGSNAERSGGVSVHLGDGKGSFSGPANFSVNGPYIDNGADRPGSVAVGDFDSDKDKDLFVTESGGFITASDVSHQGVLLLGDGKGSFSAPGFVTLGPGQFPNYHKAVGGDISNDGKDDVVLVGGKKGAWYLTGLLGGIELTSTTPEAQASQTIRAGRSVALADLNGDARLDPVVARSNATDTTGDVAAYLSTGSDFSFAWKDEEAGTGTVSVAVADFNGDKKQDLAAANFGSGDISVYLGAGDGSFGPKKRFAVGDYPISVAAADLDLDGKQDLAVARDGQEISVLRGTGDGSFRAPAKFPVDGVMLQGWSGDRYGDGGHLAVGDFDRNGAPDLAVANSATEAYAPAGLIPTFSVLMNAKEGSPPPVDDADCKKAKKKVKKAKKKVKKTKKKLKKAKKSGNKKKVKKAKKKVKKAKKKLKKAKKQKKKAC